MRPDAATIRRYVHLAALILEAVDRFLVSEQLDDEVSATAK